LKGEISLKELKIPEHENKKLFREGAEKDE
jgi:hypothetical protein